MWILLVLSFTGAGYFWTATSAGSRLTQTLPDDDLYNRLTDGFLAGQLSFLEKPDNGLLQLADPWDPVQNGPLRQFHDVSYYRGRFYLYFGAAPSVVLLLPWKLLTGTYLPQNMASVVFAWAGALFGIASLVVIRRRFFPLVRGWVGGFCLLALAWGNFVPVLLRRPVFYELAISSAYAFLMLALLAVLLSLQSVVLRRVWLVLAGLALGMAVASRPNLVFGAVVLLVPLFPFWRAWRGRLPVDRVKLQQEATLVFAPFAVIIVGLMAYNYQRFGSPFEFGTSYMFSGIHPQRDVVTSARFIPVNLWYYLFSPAQYSVFFPFVQVIQTPWFKLPAGYSGQENVYGALWNLPFLWMLLGLVCLWRGARGPAMLALRYFAVGTLALVAMNALVLGRVGGAANRYMVDLLPPLFLLACLGVFLVEDASTSRITRVVMRMFWCSALGFTLLFNLFVSLQHNELLRHHNPAAYQKLAHVFNYFSLWTGQTSPDKTGPLRIRLKFPVDRTGKLEPLIVTGLSFRADFLYLYYTDDRHVQIGFEHTSYGGAITDPIAVDYAREHTVDVEMGSFYPPIEHPYFDDMDPAEIGRRKRTLRVSLNGREVLAKQFDFYDSSPGDVSVGHNPVSDAFGRVFTGRIVLAERLRGP